MTTQKIVWSLLVAGAVMTAACGDSKSSMNPVAPSAVVVEGPQNEGASSAVSGPQAKGGIPGPPDGKGKDKDKDKDKEKDGGRNPQTPTNTSPGGLRKVEIEGLIQKKGTNSITVNAQEVTVPTTCPIRHGSTQFAFSDLHVGDRVHVRANRSTSEGSGLAATTTLLEATEVILQNPGDGEGSGDDTPTPLVSVTATDDDARETGNNTGTFRLTRSGSSTLLTSSLTVTFTLTGTATNGTDYDNLALTATFAAGQAAVDVVVRPKRDNVNDPSETVILTLTTVAPYELGAPASATVTIR